MNFERCSIGLRVMLRSPSGLHLLGILAPRTLPFVGCVHQRSSMSLDCDASSRLLRPPELESTNYERNGLDTLCIRTISRSLRCLLRILRGELRDIGSKGLERERKKFAVSHPDLILRACESIDFRTFRHESNQGLRPREIVKNRIDSQTLRRRAKRRLEGWMQGMDSRPSFETPRLRRESAAGSAAPQDEVIAA
jgi:hypothetical protein